MRNIVYQLDDKIVLLSQLNYNYTLHSLGVIGTILLLNIIVSYQMEKNLAFVFHYGSLFVIIVINKDYLKNFKLEYYK